ncbi:MAG: glycosyltransferase family 1 protein [Verrucomicrobia bacterium]|nr:glycosyltransferase family 1 protein [Verrucomicrobiota bacterium]
MKIGFICPQAPGHLNAITSLARHTQTRGHEVVLLFSSGAGGLPFISGEEQERIFTENRAEISKRQGEDALKFSMGLLMDMSESMIKALPGIVKSNQIDALVIDDISFYVQLAALELGIPYIHASAAMHFDYSGHTPLMMYPWPHETNAAAQARNRDGAAKFVQMLNEVNGGIRAHAEAAGLKIDWDNPHSTLSPWASISQVPKAFDFETSHWPAQFHHTGPWDDGKSREPVDFPWDRLTGEPLIYASMGTILNGRPEVFRTIIAALAKHKDLQLVLSIGEQIDPQQLGPVPKNGVVVKRAPQLDVLKLASVCITHSGMNTVLESLARGVPQVAIPVAFDQPGIGARIAHHRTGVVTSLDKLTADHLSELVTEVLNNSTYRNNAQRMQRAIAEANGLSAAVDIIEQALGASRNSQTLVLNR